jgi:hypothetical protein
MDPSKDEIRLLEIDVHNADKISCSLEVVALSEDPRFTALSYVRVDKSTTEEISINGE